MPPLLVHQIEAYCRQNFSFQPDDTVIVAISGGADSTALLHLLAESDLNLNLVAAYINHGLRPQEAEVEMEFVKECAKRLAIPFIARHVEVKTFQRKHKSSPEEAARIARYEELEGLRSEYQGRFIAVAHTADDQAEEVLIRLIRGTGLKGLSGMSCKNGKIIRPLLTQTKASLLAYLAEREIGFCHDSSNDERIFLRNKVRLDLLPLLERDFNPSIRNTLLRTSEIIQQDEALLAQICEERFQKLTTLQCDTRDSLLHLELDRREFRTEHLAIQRRILEVSCWRMGNKPTFRTIQQLQNLLTHGQNGAQLHLSQGLRVHLDNDTIRFSYPAGKRAYRGDGTAAASALDCRIDKPGSFQLPELGRTLSLQVVARGECELDRADVLMACADDLSFPLTLRSPQPGEKFHHLGSPGKKKIARILSDMKIRAELRSSYPVLCCGERPIALVGAKLADEFKVTARTRKVLVIGWSAS